MHDYEQRLKTIFWHVIRTRFFDGVRPKMCSLPLFQLEGKTKRSHRDLFAIAFANKELAHYFSKISYAEETEPKYVGKVRFSDIPSIIADMKPDVVFAGTSSVFSNFLLSKGFFVLPYINFSLDISDPYESIYNKMHRGKRKAIRQIEKLDYTYEITTDHKKLELFYNEMYVPRILSSHGKSAEVVSFAECERLFRKGGLILAKLDDVYVSGAIYVHNGAEVYVPMVGASETGKRLIRTVELIPLYFLISWGKKNGYKTIDYGSCKPFLNNGVFQYKKELGMKIKPMTGSDLRILGVKFCNFGKGVQEFLLDNPFAFVNGEEIKSLMIFSPEGDLHRAYCIPGLSGSIVLCPISGSPQLLQLNESLMKFNSNQTLFFDSLLEMISEEGYEAFNLNSG